MLGVHGVKTTPRHTSKPKRYSCAVNGVRIAVNCRHTYDANARTVGASFTDARERRTNPHTKIRASTSNAPTGGGSFP